ncbi:MAG: hypothetical protein QM490_02795 [Candidatus Gracilibacteria bacterium]
MIVKIIYALFFITGGASIIKYRKIVKSWTGNFVWAEQFLGRGGTYAVILFFGICLIFYGVIYPFGGIEGFLKL